MSNLWARLLNTRQRPNKHQLKKPPPKTSKRLLFALCPEESTREELVAVLGMFPRQLSDNWTRPANLHINLVYLGGADASWLDDLKQAADGVNSKDFALSLDRLTYWPHKHLLCLTPSSIPAPLEGLAADLAGNLEDVGFNIEKRPFRPYLTLARESAYPPPETRLEQPILWNVTSFALVESRPDGLGVAHEILGTWPLSKPAVKSG